MYGSRSVLELEKVTSGYGRTTILHGISFEVRPGEAVALIGRNGMGKTTTVRTIMGLLPPRAGRICFKSWDITHASPERISRLGIGYVPEGRGIFPTLTVYENLTMASRPGPWTLERIYAMFPRLKSRRDDMGNQLSGGEQQMLSIGRALLLNPELIVLDEATEGLAPLVQDEIWDCLQHVKDTGMSILVIDKDVGALLKLVDRHYVLQKGEIRAVRTSQEIRSNREEIEGFLALSGPDMRNHTVQVDRSVSPAKLSFPDIFNVCVPFLDKHIQEGRGTKVLAHWQTRKLTYGDLYHSVLSLGNALRSLGIQPGDRVALLLKDTPAFYYAFLASVRIGAIVIPVNTFLRAMDYAYILKDSQAKALFVGDGPYEEVKRAIEEPGLALRHLIAADGAPQEPRWLSIEAMIANAVPDCPPADTAPSSQCFWLYSSGSTGSPKAAVHEHKDMIYASQHFGVGVIGLTGDDVIFSAPKLFFAYGVGNSLAFPLYTGGSCILLENRPTADNTIEMINGFRPTVYFGVPTLYAAQLAAIDNGKSFSRGRIRFCHSGGEALPAPLFTRWREATGLEIYDGIGSSEVLHIYVSNGPRSLKAGSSGVAVPGYEIRIADPDGKERPQGEAGELWVRGDSVAKFYWNKPEKNATSWQDGWFRTGDMVYRDGDGFYHFCGRDDDMLKVGGIWVAPFEVESALARHSAVLEAAVVGAEDENGLVKPKAYCVLREPATATDALADELIGFVKNYLAPYKYPRWVVFLDELPKTASGKIQRFRLRSVSAAEK
jgi:benzoate-CoA ligase family protein